MEGTLAVDGQLLRGGQGQLKVPDGDGDLCPVAVQAGNAVAQGAHGQGVFPRSREAREYQLVGLVAIVGVGVNGGGHAYAALAVRHLHLVARHAVAHAAPAQGVGLVGIDRGSADIALHQARLRRRGPGGRGQRYGHRVAVERPHAVRLRTDAEVHLAHTAVGAQRQRLGGGFARDGLGVEIAVAVLLMEGDANQPVFRRLLRHAPQGDFRARSNGVLRQGHGGSGRLLALHGQGVGLDGVRRQDIAVLRLGLEGQYVLACGQIHTLQGEGALHVVQTVPDVLCAALPVQRIIPGMLCRGVGQRQIHAGGPCALRQAGKLRALHPALQRGNRNVHGFPVAVQAGNAVAQGADGHGVIPLGGEAVEIQGIFPVAVVGVGINGGLQEDGVPAVRYPHLVARHAVAHAIPDNGVGCAGIHAGGVHTVFLQTQPARGFPRANLQRDGHRVAVEAPHAVDLRADSVGDVAGHVAGFRLQHLGG